VPSRPRRTVLLTAVGAAAVVVLTACGGGGSGGGSGAPKAGDVASIPSSGAGSAPATQTAAPDSGRPQIRLDSSAEDINRMYDSYYACLTQKAARTRWWS
jgi:hypothetical protein